MSSAWVQEPAQPVDECTRGESWELSKKHPEVHALRGGGAGGSMKLRLPGKRASIGPDRGVGQPMQPVKRALGLAGYETMPTQYSAQTVEG